MLSSIIQALGRSRKEEKARFAQMRPVGVPDSTQR